MLSGAPGPPAPPAGYAHDAMTSPASPWRARTSILVNWYTGLPLLPSMNLIRRMRRWPSQLLYPVTRLSRLISLSLSLSHAPASGYVLVLSVTVWWIDVVITDPTSSVSMPEWFRQSMCVHGSLSAIAFFGWMRRWSDRSTIMWGGVEWDVWWVGQWSGSNLLMLYYKSMQHACLSNDERSIWRAERADRSFQVVHTPARAVMRRLSICACNCIDAGGSGPWCVQMPKYGCLTVLPCWVASS